MAKKRGKCLLEVEVAPYGWLLRLFTDREAYYAFTKKTEAERERFSDCNGICTTQYEECCVVIGLFTAKSSVLVHELTHAAIRILEHVGVPLTGDCSEAAAYLMGHLYEHCSIALNDAARRKPAKR